MTDLPKVELDLPDELKTPPKKKNPMIFIIVGCVFVCLGVVFVLTRPSAPTTSNLPSHQTTTFGR